MGAIGQSADMPGVKTMDETMTYTETGTFYYVCSVMCMTSTWGPNDQYCHCGGFTHKLIVNVVPVPASPPKGDKDIVDTAVAAGSFTVLAEALTKADLVTTLKGTGPFTVFAPTDDAFAAALTALGVTKEELLDRADLAAILTYHVVSGSVKSTDLTNGMKAATVQGSKVTITIDGTTVKVNDATVSTADIMCSNGVIHIIDQVILPPADGAPEPEPAAGTTAKPSAVSSANGLASFTFGGILTAFLFA